MGVYRINYQITGGKVNNIVLVNYNRGLLASVCSTSNGRLKLELPRNLIDSKKQGNMDDNFRVLEDGKYTSTVNEIRNSAHTRALAIDFEKGSRQIEIVGTRGPMTATVLTLSSIRSVPWGHSVTIRGKLGNATGFGTGIPRQTYR
jgi:hypothetical protein